MYRKICFYAAVALLGIAVAVLTAAVFMIMTVRGSGMEPAINDGDKVLINKLADTHAVGDVVAFRSNVYGEEGEGSILVRRVAGSSGDTVEIKDNIFYLNGKPYDKYMKEPAAMDNMNKIHLSNDEIFVLSDNRKSSMDSRNEAIGVLKSSDCVGKVCFE